MCAMKVLLVDDDPKFRGMIRRGLEESDIDCTEAGSVTEAQESIAARGPFSLVLLDVMMPDGTGWEFLRGLREGGRDVPVIFLTARHEVEERVKGLELGADDYVIKPFAFSELLARMQAVLRRRDTLPTIEAGDLRLDLATRSAVRAGHHIEVSAREFEFLCALARRPGEVLSRKELLSTVWNIDFDPGTNVVDVLVARLRRKFDWTGSPLIETVVGQGYRLANKGKA